jgi:hypothetical protein
MTSFKKTVTATYSVGDEVSRTYDIEAETEEQARNLALIRYGRDEFDEGRSFPPSGVRVD